MALLNPYLSFSGNAREAMEFYKSVFGGELTLSTFGEFQMPGITPEDVDKVMHSQLTTASGFTLMGSDTPSSMPQPGGGSSITISLSGPEDGELRGYWDKLSDGGQVTLPLAQAPWGDWFGQLVDRFGTSWMLDITPEAPAEG
ncbi:MAG: VOC family protein [Propionicimonas sp.]|nr:VOC family protein [Propionicimonas sp.]